MNYQHLNLAADRWQTLSLLEQLGNIGSEVGRAIAWQQKGVHEQQERAFMRALELFDLTIQDKRWRQRGRLKELLRAREVLTDYFYGDNLYGTTPESLERYFYHFAYAARLGR